MCGCQPHVMLLLSNAILMEHTKILFPDTNDRNSMYSLRPKLWTKCCFMKQKCHLQSGIAQYENVATPFSSKAIHTTH